jgi:hypothetical protein
LFITVNCASTLSPNSLVPQTITWRNGKFPRVQYDLGFTGAQALFPVATSIGNGQWTFNTAPTGSVYAFTQDQTVVTTTMTGPTNTTTQVSPGLWQTVITSTTTYSSVRLQEVVSLTNTGDANKFAACFSPDVAGTYSLTWTGQGYCSETITQTATLTAACNTAPVADAGANPTNIVFNGNGLSRVVLNGKSSYDPDGDYLFAQWDITDAPVGSIYNSTIVGFNINNAQTLEASFIPDVSGTYTVALRVSDGCQNTTASITVTVACEAHLSNLDQAAVTYAYDGFTPIAVTHFSVTASPRCSYQQYLTLVDFEPYAVNYNPPAPEPAVETAAASTVALSVFALFVAMIVLLL